MGCTRRSAPRPGHGAICSEETGTTAGTSKADREGPRRTSRESRLTRPDLQRREDHHVGGSPGAWSTAWYGARTDSRFRYSPVVSPGCRPGWTTGPDLLDRHAGPADRPTMPPSDVGGSAPRARPRRRRSPTHPRRHGCIPAAPPRSAARGDADPTWPRRPPGNPAAALHPTLMGGPACASRSDMSTGTRRAWVCERSTQTGSPWR